MVVVLMIFGFIFFLFGIIICVFFIVVWWLFKNFEEFGDNEIKDNLFDFV